MVTYGSACSGIEEATAALHSSDRRATWYAEIEPFPNAVLAHHYPATPNLGDMTPILSAEQALLLSYNLRTLAIDIERGQVDERTYPEPTA